MSLKEFTRNRLGVESRPVVLVVKNPPANAEVIRDVDLIPGLGRSPGGGNGNPLRCLCQIPSMGLQTVGHD